MSSVINYLRGLVGMPPRHKDWGCTKLMVEFTFINQAFGAGLIAILGPGQGKTLILSDESKK